MWECWKIFCGMIRNIYFFYVELVVSVVEGKINIINII